MGIEIERKFLIKNATWRAQVARSIAIKQGYLATTDKASIRIRIQDTEANINIKAARAGTSRAEYEYPIPMTEAETMLATLCHPPLIEKTRHLVRYGEHLWEIDEFYGDNEGLIVAEIELNHPEASFAMPEWVGKEVSDILRYYNNQLSQCPYQAWPDSDKLLP